MHRVFTYSNPRLDLDLDLDTDSASASASDLQCTGYFPMVKIIEGREATRLLLHNSLVSFKVW